MRALLSVSFGTSHEDTRVKTIDAIDERLRGEFPEWPFYSAWTSARIVQKVKDERGEHHDTLQEAFNRLSADGVNDLVVSTTCLLQGSETGKIAAAVDAWLAVGGRTAHVAKPLLRDGKDRQVVARAIADEFAGIPEDDALLLMGHGSAQGSNQVYSQLQADLHGLGCSRFFVATIEGEPIFEDILPRISALGECCVHLAPLMIVAGDHAKNDLAGTGARSWASRLASHGIATQVHLKGLGEYDGIRRLVCDHVRDSL